MALEFALIAPVMITLMLGEIKMTNAIRMQATLNIVAGQLTEMTATQAGVVASAASARSDETGVLSDMCAGAVLSMLRYDATTRAASIASITNATILSGIMPVQDWESDTSTATELSR